MGRRSRNGQISNNGEENMLEYIIGATLLVPMFWACWESTLMLDERKKRYRAGTHDYYDNPIKKDSEC